MRSQVARSAGVARGVLEFIGGGASQVIGSELILIGYWRGEGVAGQTTDPGLPSPSAFVESEWDMDERDLVCDYLGRGFVVRAYAGLSPCRLCARVSGSLELSDGTYLWPEDLKHYVEDHDVRPPDEFCAHVFSSIEALETAGRDDSWWRGLASPDRGERPLELTGAAQATYPSPCDSGTAPVWDNYVVAQVAQASLGSIPRSALAFGVMVSGLDVRLVFQLRVLDDEGQQDMQDIVSELEAYLGGDVRIESVHEIREWRSIDRRDGVRWVYLARVDGD